MKRDLYTAEYLRPSEVYIRFGVNPMTLSRWGREGVIKITKIVGRSGRRGTTYVKRVDIEALMGTDDKKPLAGLSTSNSKVRQPASGPFGETDVAAAIRELALEVRNLGDSLREIREPILRTLTRKESRAQQAKRAGCSVRTLLRRERRERIRLMAEGA